MLTEEKAFKFGPYCSYIFRNTPKRIGRLLAYYKFASRMIGKNKKVLDIGCNEGIGTYLVGKNCGFAKGIDFDTEAIVAAQENFTTDYTSFSEEDFLQMPPTETYDAIINFDVIEHIYPEHASDFFQKMSDQLVDEGLVIIGTPSEISQEYASAVTKKGHVNIYSHIRLEKEMREFFEIVFIFPVHDEIVHTGYLPLAHYFIAMGCKKKK